MIGKELKRQRRSELVDIIYQLKKNELDMQEEIESLKNELQDKRIRISVAGSIADAAMSVNNVFSTAQTTADLYLKEIARMKEDTEKECERKIAAADKKASEILADGRKKFAELKTQYDNLYEKWQQLQLEIAVLEQMKKQESFEGTNNG